MIQTTKNPPVLIIGAGPVGQMAALMLSQHGVATKLIDKRMKTLTAPKAHAVNARTLEICESIGVSAERLRELGASANDAGFVRFVGTLTGPEFGCLPYERQDDAAFEATPFPLTNIPQPMFEAELETVIASRLSIDFERGVECTGVTETDDSLIANLRNVNTGEEYQQNFSYAVVADGAGSSLRDALGIKMEGPELLQDFLMIHFSADLRPYTEDRRGVLYFLFEPGVSGTLIAYDQAKTWVLMHPWNKNNESIEDYTDERCRELINRAIGKAADMDAIENISQWSMTAQIADRYRSGRCFLVGDAAHRFPPAGGLGLNTGAGDAQNLTWKLAAVLGDKATEELLDTYEVERQPIAKTNSEQSLNNAAKLFDLILAIHGTDPAGTADHYASVASNPSGFPELAKAVDAQKPHFDSFALQMGYRYNSHAVVGEAPTQCLSDVSDYQPSWEVGAHFPHHWVNTNEGQKPLQYFFPVYQFSVLAGPDTNLDLTTNDINMVRFGQDVVLDLDWSTLSGLPDEGGLLIRPDGHIAARFDQLEVEELVKAQHDILSGAA